MPNLPGFLYDALAVAVAASVTAALGFVSRWLASKSSTNKVARVTLRVWEVVSSAVAGIAASAPAVLREMTADGKIDAAERAKLRAMALVEVKRALGQQGIDDVADVLKLAGSAVEPYLSGLIERALGDFLAPSISNAPNAALVAPGS